MINRIDEKYSRIKILLVVFLINLILVLPLLIFGGANFATDSYIVLKKGLQNTSLGNVQSNRFMSAAILLFQSKLCNPILNATPYVILFLVVLAVSVSVLSIYVYEQLDKNRIIDFLTVDISVLLVFVNVYFCNILSFPECVFILAFFVAFTIGSVYLIEKATSKSMLWLIPAGVLYILALACYQQAISLLPVFVLSIECVKIGTLDDGLNNTRVYRKLLLYFAVYVLATIAYFGIASCISSILGVGENGRINLSINGILNRITYMLLPIKQYSFIRGSDIFKTKILLYCAITMFGIWAVTLIGLIRQGKKRITFFLLISTIMAYVICYVPSILSTSENIRAMFVIFSIYMILNLTTIKFQKKWCSYVVIVVLLVCYIANIGVIMKSEIELKRTNEKDAAWAKSVISEIMNYEETNDTKVTKIAFCYDGEPDYEYYTLSPYAHSALGVQWARDNIINVYFKNHSYLEVVDMEDTIYEEYFADKSWEGFDRNQLFFKDNTVYVCIF